LSEDVVDDTSTDVGHHSDRANCAGSEDVTLDRRCAHLAHSATLLEPLASCVAVATRTSRGTACSPALEVPPPRGPGDAATCPHKGLAVARPLDRGAAATDLGTTATTPDRGTAARASRSGSHGHRSHRPRVHRRACSWATAVVACAVANELGWA
jgi:hypothetical protein